MEHRPMEYAGFGRRLAAFLIDSLFVVATVILASLILRTLRIAGLFTHIPDIRSAWASLGYWPKSLIITGFLLSLGPLYNALCHSSPAQATLGKRSLNIHLASVAGRRIGPLRAFGRSLVQMLLTCFGMEFLSILTILATPRKQALHDYLAGTVVLTGRPTGAEALESWRITVSLAVPVIWIVVALFTTIGA